MGGNGKHRWKISLHRSSSLKSDKKDLPKEFICPISGSLLFDLVVVSSGQTFGRASEHVCRDLRFASSLPDCSYPDFSAIIPNLALKKTILNWCDTIGSQHPTPPVYRYVQSTLRSLMTSSKSEDSHIRVSEMDLLRGMAEKPPVNLSPSTTELNPRANHFYSSSLEESVITKVPATPLLPFTTQPLCYSSSSSPSKSSEIVSGEILNTSTTSSSEDHEFVIKLKTLEVFEQELSVISPRKITRTNEDSRASLCTSRLLTALRPLLISRYAVVQTNAVAARDNLSLEKVNKLALANPGQCVIEKLHASESPNLVGEDKIFLTVADAVLACSPRLERA